MICLTKLRSHPDPTLGLERQAQVEIKEGCPSSFIYPSLSEWEKAGKLE